MPEPPGSAHAARTVLPEPARWHRARGRSRAWGVLGDAPEGGGGLTPGRKGRVRGEHRPQPLSVLGWEMMLGAWEMEGGACCAAMLVGCAPCQWSWTGCWEGKGRPGGAGLEPAGCDSCVLVRAQRVRPAPEVPGVKPTRRAEISPLLQVLLFAPLTTYKLEKVVSCLSSQVSPVFSSIPKRLSSFLLQICPREVVRLSPVPQQCSLGISGPDPCAHRIPTSLRQSESAFRSVQH